MTTQAIALPADRRAQQGAWLFLASLLVFFLSSILLFLIYVSWREEAVFKSQQLPLTFLSSTVCLVVISLALHLSVRAIRREQHQRTLMLLIVSLVMSIAFLAIQGYAMADVAVAFGAMGPSKGVAGMVFALAMLHALHVVGGVAALVIVVRRVMRRFYDHERYWGVQFTAQYWHFLDIVWVFLLWAFWYASGGFAL